MAVCPCLCVSGAKRRIISLRSHRLHFLAFPCLAPPSPSCRRCPRSSLSASSPLSSLSLIYGLFAVRLDGLGEVRLKAHMSIYSSWGSSLCCYSISREEDTVRVAPRTTTDFMCARRAPHKYILSRYFDHPIITFNKISVYFEHITVFMQIARSNE